ncbi:MAG: undecaprenyl-phosphate galactose phosphotransferase WbaP [Pseudomonadota bacterium]
MALNLRINKTLLSKIVLVSSDILALSLAVMLARASNWAYDHTFGDAFLDWWWKEQGDIRLITFAMVAAMVVGWFWSLGHYSGRKPFWDELKEILKVLVFIGVLDAALVYLGKWQFSRLWLISTWLLALLLIPAIRFATKRILLRLNCWNRPTVILGAGANAREAAAAIQSEPLMGYDVIAFLATPADFPLLEDVKQFPVPVIPLGNDPMTALREMGYPYMVVALDADVSPKYEKLVRQLSAHYADLNVIPSLRGLPLLGMEMTHFFSHDVLMLRVRNNLSRLGPQIFKRVFDVVAAAGLLLLLSPLFAYLSWRIRQDGGSAVYAHTRVGRGGELFQCLKFRSMIPDAEAVLQDLLARDSVASAEWGRDFKLKSDPRITSIGEFLRKSSLDELPQLWNVLKGDMSLVGPRPVVEAELERYGDLVDYYLEARPGITGLWQISGRSNIEYSDRVNLDAWYVQNWSLWYDLVILLKTVRVVVRCEGAY